jgi:ketosteroid isomerase-like protein
MWLALPALSWPVGTDIDSIVEAERAFCKVAIEKGARQAFLAYLADDGIIFRPGPVEAKKWWTERSEQPGVLMWEPAFADVSRGGDLGYTTGPWEFREQSASDPPVAFGHYVTIWRRQQDGSWKVALDTGVSHQKPQGGKPAGVESPVREGPRGSPEGGAPPVAEADRDRGMLLDLDRGLTPRTFEFTADDAIRVYRDGSQPMLGRRAAHSALSARGEDPVSRPAGAAISRSGDLGYTYGTAEQKKPGSAGAPPERAGYLRIWKRRDRDSAWKLVLDVATPFPPPQTQPAP